MQKDPKIIIESVIDNNGTSEIEDRNIHIFPLTITRYAILELIDSPFINPEIPFGISTVAPTAYVFVTSSEKLRKYNTKNIDKLTEDALEWCDKNLTLEDFPTLIKNITDQFQNLSKAAPSSGDSISTNDGSKKK